MRNIRKQLPLLIGVICCALSMTSAHRVYAQDDTRGFIEQEKAQIFAIVQRKFDEDINTASFNAYGVHFEWGIDSMELDQDNALLNVNYRYHINPNRPNGEVYLYSIAVNLRLTENFELFQIYKAQLKANEARPAIQVKCIKGQLCYTEEITNKCNGFIRNCEPFGQIKKRNSGLTGYFRDEYNSEYVLHLLNRLIDLYDTDFGQ